MFTQEQKLFIVKEIYSRKAVLFGAFNENITRDAKKTAWTEVFNAALSIGIVVPKNSDYKYIRDTFWPNVRRAAMVIFCICINQFTHIIIIIIQTNKNQL